MYLYINMFFLILQFLPRKFYFFLILEMIKLRLWLNFSPKVQDYIDGAKVKLQSLSKVYMIFPVPQQIGSKDN